MNSQVDKALHIESDLRILLRRRHCRGYRATTHALIRLSISRLRLFRMAARLP